MTTTVTIERLKDENGTYYTNSVILPGSYTVNGKLRVLTDLGEYKTFEIDDKSIPHVRDYSFDKYTKTMNYTYDAASQDLINLQTIDVCNIFWAQHPLLKVNGKSHAKTSPAAMFNFVNSVQESNDNINKFNDELAVANKIVEMTPEQRQNVAYYYGKPPQAMSDSDLTLMLANFKTGVCIKDTDNFLKVWATNNSIDRDTIVILKKAVALGVIPNKIIEGRNNYYLGSELIATTENDLLSWAKNNIKAYEEYVLRSVFEKEAIKKAPETKKDALDETVTLAPKSYTFKEVEAMRNEAKVLREDGFIRKDLLYTSCSIAMLIEEIAKGKGAKEASRKKQLEDAI